MLTLVVLLLCTASCASASANGKLTWRRFVVVGCVGEQERQVWRCLRCVEMCQRDLFVADMKTRRIGDCLRSPRRWPLQMNERWQDSVDSVSVSYSCFIQLHRVTSWVKWRRLNHNVRSSDTPNPAPHWTLMKSNTDTSVCDLLSCRTEMELRAHLGQRLHVDCTQRLLQETNQTIKCITEGAVQCNLELLYIMFHY